MAESIWTGLSLSDVWYTIMIMSNFKPYLFTLICISKSNISLTIIWQKEKNKLVKLEEREEQNREERIPKY